MQQDCLLFEIVDLKIVARGINLQLVISKHAKVYLSEKSEQEEISK